jgi:hypothetical protein
MCADNAYIGLTDWARNDLDLTFKVVKNLICGASEDARIAAPSGGLRSPAHPVYSAGRPRTSSGRAWRGR